MSPSSVHAKLVFVDLETTGANFANDRIIEIGIVEVDERGAREWRSLVNPDVPIPPFITRLTGIDATMVASAPAFAQLSDSVLEKLQDGLFIAHNARFDYNFLRREFQRLGVKFRANCLCTVKLSRKLFPEHHRHSLETLVSRFGIAVAARHRALDDARALWHLWQQWQAIKSPEEVDRAVDAIVGRPQLPPHLDPGIIDDLPEAHGAYALLGEDGRVLKVKRASNLRQQVIAHFLPDGDKTLFRDTRQIAWHESAGDFGARLGELLLAGNARKDCAELCAWRLVNHGDGDLRPELVFAADTDFSDTPDLYGLYHSRREALTALRKLVEANHLCHSLCGLGDNVADKPCVGFRQRSCRGACIGKEPRSSHGVRLLLALARQQITPWPFAGAIALVERDEFGMREDFHLVYRWRYLGTAQSEPEMYERLECTSTQPFDPELYRLLAKTIRAGKLRIQALPAPGVRTE